MNGATERVDVTRLAGPLLALLAATVLVLAVRHVAHDGAVADAPSPPASRAAETRPARPPAPASEPPAAAPPAAARRAEATYTIRSGDTLAAVAQRHDVSLEALLAANPGVDPVALRVGQQIRLP